VRIDPDFSTMFFDDGFAYGQSDPMALIAAFGIQPLKYIEHFLVVFAFDADALVTY
jgi:hypothetical protein